MQLEVIRLDIFDSEKPWINSPYCLNRCHDRGNDQHRGECYHDPVGEVVHIKEETHVANTNQQEGLEEGVGHVEFHSPSEHDLHNAT